MKRCGLITAAVSSLALSAFFFLQTDSSKGAASPLAAAFEDKGMDPLQTPAGRRYRLCEPHHWRACLLQR
jgi:hypothetical protein